MPDSPNDTAPATQTAPDLEAVAPQSPWNNMFVAPEDDPRSDGGFVGERDTLVGYLRDYRLTLEMKCLGLDADEMAQRSVPPSDLSLLGLVRHMGDVEIRWFHQVLAGEEYPRRHRVETVDTSFSGALPDPVMVETAWADWRTEVGFAERFVEQALSLDVSGLCGPEEWISLREVMVHMIEEYARHCGHADLLRECIDGRVGQ